MHSHLLKILVAGQLFVGAGIGCRASKLSNDHELCQYSSPEKCSPETFEHLLPENSTIVFTHSSTRMVLLPRTPQMPTVLRLSPTAMRSKLHCAIFRFLQFRLRFIHAQRLR